MPTLEAGSGLAAVGWRPEAGFDVAPFGGGREDIIRGEFVRIAKGAAFC
jgi:hypothetical protein